MTRHPFINSTHAFTCRGTSLDLKTVGRDDRGGRRGYSAGAFVSDDGSEKFTRGSKAFIWYFFVALMSFLCLALASISACNSLPIPFSYPFFRTQCNCCAMRDFFPRCAHTKSIDRCFVTFKTANETFIDQSIRRLQGLYHPDIVATNNLNNDQLPSQQSV